MKNKIIDLTSKIMSKRRSIFIGKYTMPETRKHAGNWKHAGIQICQILEDHLLEMI